MLAKFLNYVFPIFLISGMPALPRVPDIYNNMLSCKCANALWIDEKAELLVWLADFGLILTLLDSPCVFDTLICVFLLSVVLLLS
jgi:hypothetical protein